MIGIVRALQLSAVWAAKSSIDRFHVKQLDQGKPHFTPLNGAAGGYG
jgi:hypothetical protein